MNSPILNIISNVPGSSFTSSMSIELIFITIDSKPPSKNTGALTTRGESDVATHAPPAVTSPEKPLCTALGTITRVDDGSVECARRSSSTLFSPSLITRSYSTLDTGKGGSASTSIITMDIVTLFSFVLKIGGSVCICADMYLPSISSGALWAEPESPANASGGGICPSPKPTATSIDIRRMEKKYCKECRQYRCCGTYA